MSRLDFKRKKEKERERQQSGENVFLNFMKAHMGLIILIVIVAAVITSGIIIVISPQYSSHLSPSNENQLYLDENTIFEMPYIAKKTLIKALGNESIILNTESIMALTSDGKIKWQTDVSLNEPMLSVCGEYILASDRGGRNIYLINEGKVILKTVSPDDIINAKVCPDGKFIIIYEEAYYKGALSVRDAKDNDIFVWHSGSAYIIDAVQGSDSNKICLALVDSEASSDEVSITSEVLMFNLYESEPYFSYKIDGCLITNVFKGDGGFDALTNKKVIAFSNDGTIKGEYDYGGRRLNKIYKNDSELILSFEAEKNSIAVIESGANEKCSINIEQTPNFISAASDRIAYGGGNKITVCDMNGKELYLIESSKQFENVILLGGGSRAVGITSASIDIIEIK